MGSRLSRVKDWERISCQAGFQPAAAVAAYCSVSLRQLERHFKNEFKTTPTRWLRELRCRLSLKLLSAGYSTKAAAADLKYANPSHFCHEFRKVYGASPQMTADPSSCRPNVFLISIEINRSKTVERTGWVLLILLLLIRFLPT